MLRQALEKKEVGLRILKLGMDTHTPTGKLMLTVLGGVAQFEREKNVGAAEGVRSKATAWSV